ncbi:hypothetical protein [uncultured Tateyamaria sp.]|uniref:hypothetical protein n=1 Tax=uncultured Tateyamaria sp. TaxID=455651 RepID=UPI00261D9738|nr:hypothetical protein [uncultured Tateyamaria sp.]
MTGIQRTLLAIAAFLAVAIGTFIYFIANWDASNTAPIGMKNDAAPFTLPNKLRGLGQRPSPAPAAGATA